MQILPCPSPLLRHGDRLADLLSPGLRSGDIIVISSKAVAMTEDGPKALPEKVSGEAQKHAVITGQDPAFVQAILDEMKTLNGKIINACPGALLTEVQPQGMTGSILVANAGLDQSNAGDGMVIGWPRDPVKSAHDLRIALQKSVGGPIGVIITDSCCLPRRRGVIAIALTVSGFDPIVTQKGKKDLFGRDLQLTDEAVADQLATAANAVMGNAAQSIPAVIIRDYGLPMTDFEGWVPGISAEEDLFGHSLVL